MSELRRWSEEGATSEELALLDASRRERPSMEARKRTMQALGLGAVLVATSTAAGATARFSIIGKIIGVLVVAAGVGAGIFYGTKRELPDTRAQHPTATAESRGARTPDAVPSSPPAVDAEALPQDALDPESLALLPGPRPRASASASLSEEVAALEVAHQALAQHDADGALRALDQYRTKFPGGALGSEAIVLRVQAYLARGDSARASALANTFAARHPDSPYAKRVLELVGGTKKK